MNTFYHWRQFAFVLSPCSFKPNCITRITPVCRPPCLLPERVVYMQNIQSWSYKKKKIASIEALTSGLPEHSTFELQMWQRSSSEDALPRSGLGREQLQGLRESFLHL